MRAVSYLRPRITKDFSSVFPQFHVAVCIFRAVKSLFLQTFYSVFGQYVLTNEVFDQLRKNIIDSGEDNTKEVELTTALEQVRKNTGMIGIILDGDMYDMGIPKALKNTYLNYNDL